MNIFLVLFLFFVNNFYISLSVVKINKSIEEYSTISNKERANKCEKLTFISGVETTYKYVQDGEWSKVYKVNKDDVVRFEIEENSVQVKRKDYFVILSFNPLLGTKTFIYPYDMMFVSNNTLSLASGNALYGIKNSLRGSGQMNYVEILDSYFNYINQTLASLSMMPTYYLNTSASLTLSKIFVDNIFDFVNQYRRKENEGIVFNTSDIVEMELLSYSQILDNKQLFSIGNHNNDDWVLPNANLWNKVLKFDFTKGELYDRIIYSSRVVKYTDLQKDSDETLIDNLILKFGIDDEQKNGVGLEMSSSRGPLLKYSGDKFFRDRYLYYKADHDGVIRFRILPEFDYRTFFSTIKEEKSFNNAGALSEYYVGSYLLKVSVVSKLDNPNFYFKIVGEENVAEFMVNDLNDNVVIPMKGELFIKTDFSSVRGGDVISDASNSIGFNDSSAALQVKVIRNIDPPGISSFMHDFAMMLVDLFRDAAEATYMGLSQNSLLQAIFKIMLIIATTINSLRRDVVSGKNLFVRMSIASLIMFNFEYAYKFNMYLMDGVMVFVRFIFHFYFNVLVFQPFQIFDIVLLKLIGPFTVFFVGQLLSIIFAIYVLVIVFSFFTQMLGSLIAQAFIRPMEIYIGIISCYFFIGFLPILLVFFMLFDFSKDVPIVFIRYMIFDLFKKITAYFVFILFIEFIGMFIFGVIGGQDLMTCYDSNGMLIEDSGRDFNIWSFLILYVLSTVIMPVIKSFEKAITSVGFR